MPGSPQNSIIDRQAYVASWLESVIVARKDVENHMDRIKDVTKKRRTSSMSSFFLWSIGESNS